MATNLPTQAMQVNDESRQIATLALVLKDNLLDNSPLDFNAGNPRHMTEIANFISNHTVLTLVWFALLVILLVGEFRRLTRKYREIDTLEATRLLNKENALLVDVRNAKDYTQSHAVNAIHIPLEQVKPDHPKLADPSRPVIFYCYSGMSSQRAAAALANADRNNIYSLQGGFGAWQGDNLPVESNRKPGKKKKKS